MAEDFRQKTQRLAAGYRDFWSEHSGMAMALGFVPVVGQVMGIADAIATHNDERASLLEKGLATAGVLPFGKAASLIKGAMGGKAGGALLSVVGPATIKRADDAGLDDRLLKRHYDPDFKTEVAEMRNYGTPNQGLIDVTNKTKQLRQVPYRTAVKDDPLSEILPEEVGDLPTTFASRRTRPSGDVEDLQAGEGSFTWGSNAKSEGGRMTLGTGSAGRTIEPGDYTQIRRTAAHETNHRVAGYEIDEGNWQRNAMGANDADAGAVGYFNNLGELDSYTTELRMNWPDQLREEVLPWQTRRAVQKKIEENLKAGKPPNYRLNDLSDPYTAKKMAERAAKEGLDPDIQRVVANGRPNWNTKPKKQAEDSWIMPMDFPEIANLDPKIGQKMTDITKDWSWSARYDGPKTNHAKAIATGQQVEPLRAKVRASDKGDTLEVVELDGLRRALAARNMFGSNSKNRIPVIFEPVDDAARKLAQNSDARKGVRPAVDLMMQDDAAFPQAFELAKDRGY